MINFFKSFVNAFSAHTFLPLPYFEDEGDKYKMAFVPLIGVIIYHLLYWSVWVEGSQNRHDILSGKS